MKTYAIVNKKHIIINSNSTRSRYSVVLREGLRARRALASREAARAYKRSLSNPQNWAIIDLRTNEVVR